MNPFTQACLAAAAVVREHTAGLFVLAFAGAAILHTALGLGRTRQWYLLPVVFGLTALGGFLLNPFADANTPADLRSALTSFETLTLLCIGQFLLLAAALVFGIRLDPWNDEPRGVVALAVAHSIPAPVVAIAMLLIEQGRLAGVPGARPESVGREVGLVVAGGLTLACAAAMMLPRRWLALPHQMLSVVLLLACMFVPCLDARLPEPLLSVNLDSVRLLWPLGLAGMAVVLAGWCWPRMSLSHLLRRPVVRPSIEKLSPRE